MFRYSLGQIYQGYRERTGRKTNRVKDNFKIVQQLKIISFDFCKSFD